MAKQDFVPTRQAERRQNGKEFVKQLLTDGTQFGVTPQEIAQAVAGFNTFDNNIETGITIDGQKQQQNKITKESDNAFVGIWRNLSRRIKGSSNYTEAIGERYKIVGAEQTVDTDNATPELQPFKAPNGWELRFNLQGYFDGINVYRKRPQESEFRRIAFDSSSPYLDSEPMVNGTEYYGYYVLGDEEVGKQSNIVKITV